jgi:chorismate mutase
VQFPLNKTVYEAGAIAIPGSDLSLLDWILREQERLHSLVRRYQSPDEYPFFPDALETPILQPLRYPAAGALHPNDVNVNAELKRSYIDNVLPAACARREERPEQQENYGSAATVDVLCLQALSRRVHFGKFVAEAKFQQETQRFVALIKSGDREGIDAAITDKAVERKVLERLRLKAKTYGTDPDTTSQNPAKIDAEAVVAMYKVGFMAVCSSLTCAGLCDPTDQDRRGRLLDAEAKGHQMGVMARLERLKSNCPIETKINANSIAGEQPSGLE